MDACYNWPFRWNVHMFEVTGSGNEYRSSDIHWNQYLVLGQLGRVLHIQSQLHERRPNLHLKHWELLHKLLYKDAC